jgi:hypothetical protein
VCQVRPADGLHFGETLQSAEVIIENSAPLVSDLEISPAQPLTTDTLSVEYSFADIDGDNETDTLFEWLIRSGEIYLRTGLKFKQLHPQFTTKGDEFVAEVTPFDGYTYGKPVISSSVKIGNSAPFVSDIHIAPEAPRTSNDLVVNYDYFDENSDAESGTSVQWFRNGQHQADLDNSLSVDRSNTKKGEKWYFTVSPSDSFMTGEQKRSPEVEVLNSPPEARSPKITNPNLRGDEDIQISFTYFDPDEDNNQRTDIRWYKDEILQPHLNDLLVIPANETAKDQQWYFQIRVHDGNETSGFNESFPVTIKNARPLIVSYYPTTSPLVINETESIEFGVVVEDMDNDAIYYSWVLENQVTFESETIGEDSVLNFATSYDDAGTYILNLTIEDWDVNSFKVYNEWNVIVNNNNRIPTISVTEPENDEPVVDNDKTLKFVIQETDEDTEDDLQISWLINGENTGSSSRSYTFTASGFSAGVHTVEVQIDDGYDIVSKKWNVTVEEDTEDLIYGRTWDEWSVLLQVLVIVITLIVAAIGFYKLRKKKGALHDYLKQIDAPMKNWQENPDKSEDDLIEISEQVENDFKEGVLEDLQYFLLGRQIKENLREIRQERVDSAFSYLPPAIHKELEIMLDDGKLTENEYQTFIGILSQSSGLTPQQKEEITEQLQRWRDVDKKRSETKTNMLNSTGNKTEEEMKGSTKK